MSIRYPAGFIRIGYDPLKVPNAPTIGTASVASSTSASITFTAPTNVGGGAITGYIATAKKTSDGTTVGATGSSSPITITGLTTDVAYTITVAAVNSFGPSATSAASNSVTPVVQGQAAYTTAGTYSWVAPAAVTSVSVVALGGGGGSWNNGGTNTNAGDSYFINTSTVKGGAGSNGTGSQPDGGLGGNYTGDGGGNGGRGRYGGGGAGGYSGAGGEAGWSSGPLGSYVGYAGSGGGAGGGGFGGGGGVDILGSGSNGAGGNASTAAGAGSGGGVTPVYNESLPNVSGGSYGGGGTGWGGSGGGGGGAGLGYKNNITVVPGNSYTVVVGNGGLGTYSRGAAGAVRIIWPGTTRSFPSTNTGDL